MFFPPLVVFALFFYVVISRLSSRACVCACVYVFFYPFVCLVFTGGLGCFTVCPCLFAAYPGSLAVYHLVLPFI